MKKLTLIIGIAFILNACGGALTYNEAIEANNNKIERQEMQQDAKDLVEAKSFSLLLEQLGALGTQQGYAVVVQNFGTKIQQDHQQLNQQLKELSKSEKIKLPAEMSDQHKLMLEQLRSAQRQEFDKQFIRIAERVYEDNIELYKRIATNGSDDEIRAYAATKLSLLRTNEERADQLEDELI